MSDMRQALVTEPPGNVMILASVLAVLIATSCYAIGRIHEWYRHALERDAAWREGYDRASHSLFRYACRPPRQATAPPATVPMPVPVSRAAGDEPGQGRRRVPARWEETTARLRPTRHRGDEPPAVVRVS